MQASGASGVGPGTVPGVAGSSRAGAREPELMAVCREFEGLFLGIILKQGLKPGALTGEPDGNAEALHEFAAEQTASALSRAGSLGIAALLHAQLRQAGGTA